MRNKVYGCVRLNELDAERSCLENKREWRIKLSLNFRARKIFGQSEFRLVGAGHVSFHSSDLKSFSFRLLMVRVTHAMPSLTTKISKDGLVEACLEAITTVWIQWDERKRDDLDSFNQPDVIGATCIGRTKCNLTIPGWHQLLPPESVGLVKINLRMNHYCRNIRQVLYYGSIHHQVRTNRNKATWQLYQTCGRHSSKSNYFYPSFSPFYEVVRIFRAGLYVLVHTNVIFIF